MAKTSFKHAALGATALALLATSQPQLAMAQEQEDDLLETIVVTARKRQETQTEIPLSVSAFSQDDIDKRGIQAIAELSDFVPGFKFEPVGTGGQSGRAAPAVRFRGVGVQVGLAGASSAGALFWDGAFVPQGIGVVPLIDLQQTEVIKGPQTAFFGRNTFAGAVNFLPSEPGDELEVRLRGQASATDVQAGYNFNAIVSGPITDKIGARIAVSTEKRPGVIDFQDGTALGEEKTTGLLGTLKFEPGENTTFKASGYYVASEDTSALGSIDGPVGAGECDRTYSGNLTNITTGESVGTFTTDISQSTRNGIFCGSIPDWNGDAAVFTPISANAPGPDVAQSSFDLSQMLIPELGGSFIDAPDGLGNTYQTWRAHLTGEHVLDGGQSINGFVSFGSNKNWGIFDSFYGRGGVDFAAGFPFPPVDINYTGFIRDSDDMSAELRFTSNSDGRLRYMAGVNYFKEDTLNYNIGQNSVTILESEVIGIFGSLDFDVTSEITLSLEGRYQWDELTQVFEGNPGTVATAGFEPASQDYGRFMPRVILQYQPEGLDLNVYGTWSQSYLQGTPTEVLGFNANPGVPADAQLDVDSIGLFTPTQKMNAFEVGVKQQIGNLQYSIAAYYMEWSDQTFFILSPFPVFANVNLAGDSEYKGIEFEVNYQPTSWLNLRGNYNYVDATFTDFVGAGSVSTQILAPGLLDSATQIDSAGLNIRYIPAHEATFSAEFQLEDVTGIESFFRADVIYTGSFFIDNFAYNKVDGAARMNIRAGANLTENLLVEVFGNNIFDNRRVQTNGGTTTGTFGGTGAARTLFGVPTRGDEWGIRFTASF